MFRAARGSDKGLICLSHGCVLPVFVIGKPRQSSQAAMGEWACTVSQKALWLPQCSKGERFAQLEAPERRSELALWSLHTYGRVSNREPQNGFAFLFNSLQAQPEGYPQKAYPYRVYFPSKTSVEQGRARRPRAVSQRVSWIGLATSSPNLAESFNGDHLL